MDWVKKPHSLRKFLHTKVSSWPVWPAFRELDNQSIVEFFHFNAHLGPKKRWWRVKSPDFYPIQSTKSYSSKWIIENRCDLFKIFSLKSVRKISKVLLSTIEVGVELRSAGRFLASPQLRETSQSSQQVGSFGGTHLKYQALESRNIRNLLLLRFREWMACDRACDMLRWSWYGSVHIIPEFSLRWVILTYYGSRSIISIIMAIPSFQSGNSPV